MTHTIYCLQTALWWASEKEPDCGEGINWCEFVKDLNMNKAGESATENDKDDIETQLTHLTH